jgi:hypothetical protein
MERGLDFYRTNRWLQTTQRIVEGKLSLKGMVDSPGFFATMFPPPEQAQEFFRDSELAKRMHCTMIVFLEKLGFMCVNPMKGSFLLESEDVENADNAYWNRPVEPGVTPVEYKFLLEIIQLFASSGFIGHSIQLANHLITKFFAKTCHPSHVSLVLTKIVIPRIRLIMPQYSKYNAATGLVEWSEQNPLLSLFEQPLPEDLNDPGILLGPLLKGRQVCCKHGLLSMIGQDEKGKKRLICILEKQSDCGFQVALQ